MRTVKQVHSATEQRASTEKCSAVRYENKPSIVAAQSNFQVKQGNLRGLH